MRKTKIICTLGPSTDNEKMIRRLMQEGMDVARFNFSHGSHEEQGERLAIIKKLRKELNLPVATLLDTKGPEIRIGTFKNDSVVLEKGQSFTLTNQEIEGSKERVSITYKDLVHDVKEGDRILIDDGLIAMEVTEVTDTDITCKVLNGGKVSNRKGINVPGVAINMPFISKKDYDDILFGIEQGFDFIACSFTRSAKDINKVRDILKVKKCNNINIIAKIENQQGVDNIDEILEVVDGIMIARGDMGVEIPLENVPVIQKMLIEKVYRAGKQVITATQMLDSMMKNPRPTRAETTDVANAIYQGTSAIMLSGETAAGKYPIEALQTMVRIAIRTEEDIDYDHGYMYGHGIDRRDITNAISHATCTTAADLSAKAIITVTKSGQTARMVSRYRPGCLIIGCTTEKQVCRQLNLSWGVHPLLINEESDIEILFDHALRASWNAGYVDGGDIVVLTAGSPLGRSGTTNLIKACVATGGYGA